MVINNLFGQVRRNEILNEETELMFPDAKLVKDEDRLSDKRPGIALDYYYFKIGDVRFKIKGQVAIKEWTYALDVYSRNNLSDEQMINIKNVFEGIIKIKGIKAGSILINCFIKVIAKSNI